MINWAFVRQVGFARWSLRFGALQFRKRILKRESELRLPTGLKISLPRESHTSTEIYVTNADMDWGAEAIFARFASSGRDFLDIGSHIGYYAAYLAPIVRCVYAFEPDPRNLTGLKRNAALTQNIEIVRIAVSSKEGTADFFAGKDSSTGSLCDVGGSSTTVTVTTVDSFVAGHPDIDVALVKTDIEGHDLEALHGMEATVAKFQPLILTECEFSAELEGLCAGWKYRIFATSRDRRTQRKSFREMTGETPGRYWTKMLFLVPESLQTAFSALTEESQ